ncbi:MAG: dTDP-4-dehydrorhamnose reductase [Kiritimatiellia bacterium]
MKVCYIGANGMLGQDFMEAAAQAGHEATGLDLPAIDITSPESVRANLPACDVVITGAAFTRVDDAEKEVELARRINADGAGNVARVCAERGMRLLHISTDYVFDGKKGSAYVETDPVNALSAYGRTKLEGEEQVQAAGGEALIVRTQSLYGIHGRNFVKAIRNQVRQGKKELTVVSDQVSSPTYTRALAMALLKLAAISETGIVHVASRGACSWFDFARAILEQSGVSDVTVKPMAAATLNYPAPRPAYSELSTERYSSWTGEQMPVWQDGLRAYLSEEEPLS